MQYSDLGEDVKVSESIRRLPFAVRVEVRSFGKVLAPSIFVPDVVTISGQPPSGAGEGRSTDSRPRWDEIHLRRVNPISSSFSE